MNKKYGILLYIISIDLKKIVGKPMYWYGFFRALHKGGYKELRDWNFDLALANDRYGNVLLKYYMNDFLINTKKPHKPFGDGKETISYNLAENIVYCTPCVKWQGFLWGKALNKLDKNHLLKTLNNERT